MSEKELSPDPASTWGASEEYRDAWNHKYGNVSPSANASKAEWVKFAVKNGLPEDEAESATRAALVERYGASQVVVAPAVTGDTTPPGDGTGASPSTADPAVRTATRPI